MQRRKFFEARKQNAALNIESRYKNGEKRSRLLF